MALASAGPYVNHLHLAADMTMPTPHHSIFTGQMLFLPPNQQRQSTEGYNECHHRLCFLTFQRTAITMQHKQLLDLCSTVGIVVFYMQDISGTRDGKGLMILSVVLCTCCRSHDVIEVLV